MREPLKSIVKYWLDKGVSRDMAAFYSGCATTTFADFRETPPPLRSAPSLGSGIIYQVGEMLINAEDFFKYLLVAEIKDNKIKPGAAALPRLIIEDVLKTRTSLSVDHVNGNVNDNRRINLRATASSNVNRKRTIKVKSDGIHRDEDGSHVWILGRRLETIKNHEEAVHFWQNYATKWREELTKPILIAQKLDTDFDSKFLPDYVD